MVFTTNRALHSRGVSILMKRLTPIIRNCYIYIVCLVTQ